jgi:hypothetical protein
MSAAEQSRGTATEHARGTVACPRCDEATAIGLPTDATVEAVDAVDRSIEGGAARTRTVRCPTGHDMHVRFSVLAARTRPEDRIVESGVCIPRWSVLQHSARRRR